MKVPTVPKKADYRCDRLEVVDQIARWSPFISVFIFLKGLLCSNATMETFCMSAICRQSSLA